MAEQRIALVTGGRDGLGREICQALAEDGLRLAVCDLDAAVAQSVAARLPGAGHAGIGLDVSDEFSMLGGAADRPGDRAHRLRRNPAQRDTAGFGAQVRQVSPLPTGETGLADCNWTIAINATGCFLTAREYIRRLPGD